MSCQFDILLGDKVSLHHFDETYITPDYLSWLNDPKVVRFSNQRFRRHTRQTCRAYLGTFSESPNLFLAICMRDSGQFVGTMTAYVEEHHGTVDLGLMIGDSAQWGKGLGLDAWQTLMSYLLTECKMRKVTGGTLRCNVGMLRIMERSGMVLEAVRKSQEIVEGRSEDILYYAKFNVS